MQFNTAVERSQRLNFAKSQHWLSLTRVGIQSSCDCSRRSYSNYRGLADLVDRLAYWSMVVSSEPHVWMCSLLFVGACKEIPKLLAAHCFGSDLKLLPMKAF